MKKTHELTSEMEAMRARHKAAVHFVNNNRTTTDLVLDVLQMFGFMAAMIGIAYLVSI